MILGLDLSLTSTGVCLYHPGGKAWRLETIHNQKAWTEEQRLDEITCACMQRTAGVQLVVIESLSFGHNTGAGSQIQALNWMVRCSLARNRVPFLMVAPSALKKFVAGSGTAKKQEMLLAVYKRWGVDLRDDNQADAFGLAKIGAAFLGLEDTDNGAQREVLEKLATPLGKPQAVRR